MIKKEWLFSLMFLVFFGQGWGKLDLDLYLNPGLCFYGDSVGFEMLSGAKLPLDQFGLPLHFLTGGSLYLSGAGATHSGVFEFGAVADFGYHFDFKIRSYKIEIEPMLGLGMVYESLTETGGGLTENIGFLILPRVDVFYQITPLFGMGLETGYHAGLYPTHAMASFYLGLNLNFRLASLMSDKKKESDAKDKKTLNEKKSADEPKKYPEIAVYLSGEELVNGKSRIDFGVLSMDSSSLETNLVLSNLGDAPLKIDGFSVGGSGLVLKGKALTKLKAKESAVLTLSLNRSEAVRNQDVKLKILSDDQDESESIFFVNGIVTNRISTNGVE